MIGPISNPTFFDFFKSSFHSNTYVSAVDLSEKGLFRHLLENVDQGAAKTAQALISDTAVQEILSEPLTYIPSEIILKNEVLKQYGFNLLGCKLSALTGERIPFYSVLEHASLPGWVIKSGAARVSKDKLSIGPSNDLNEMALFTTEESLLRIEMAKRIQNIAKQEKIDAVVPKKKLVKYENTTETTDPTKKYCILSEKVTILSVEDTVNTLKNMGSEKQRETAKKISTLIRKAGIVDASFDNIRLTAQGKIAIIDTEPAGLMAKRKEGLWNRFSSPKGASVEKCARIGLYTLMMQTTDNTQVDLFGRTRSDPSLRGFHEEIKNQYSEISTPKLSKWKIVLSIVSLGILPLIYAIDAIRKEKLHKRTSEDLQKLNMDLAATLFNSSADSTSAQELQMQGVALTKQQFALREGVPYKFNAMALGV